MLIGVDGAFLAVFGLFVAALAVLVVLTVRFVVRRDREQRAAWRAKHDASD